ncbi:MAG: hypothetical protein ACOYKE_05830 [Ferruginibacter sp.]
MHKIFFIGIFLLFTVQVTAQQTKKDRKLEKKQRINALIKQEEEGVIAYSKHTVYGLKLTSDGYGGFIEIGRAKSIRKALLFQLDIGERKHPKEEKQTNPFIPTSPFIFGKINYFYPVKLGVQQQILLGNKSNKNGVSVTGNFGGGLSLGLLRPYYLEINDVTNANRKFIKYDSPDSVIFVSNVELANLSVAGTGLGRGWSDLKIVPGIYGKTSIRFDYGRFNEMVNALEVGLTAEFYSKKIPQLIYLKQRNLFFNAYISILFGKRK